MEPDRSSAGYFTPESHRIMEPFILEKTLKIIESDQSQNIGISVRRMAWIRYSFRRK